MPRSSGTMTLVSGNPAVPGTVISSAVYNNTMNDIANELTNSIPRDGTAPPTASLPMGNFKITGIGAATLATDVPQFQQIQSGASLYLTAVAGTNTITATLASPTLAAYAAGNTFRFVAAGANTGAVTLNINALGAKAVTKSGTGALSSGDINTGATVEVIYDGIQFQLVSVQATATQAQTSTSFTTGGTATAYTLTPSPALPSLITNHRFNVTFNATAGATPTLAISGLTAKNLKYYDSTGTKQAITSTQVVANLNSDVIYDGTDYVVLNPLGAVTTAATNATYVTGTATNEYLTPAVARARNLVAGTSAATTSGTSIDFTGIPSWVKRITVMLSGVSTNGTSALILQIGDSGGIETTSYVSCTSVITSIVSTINATTGMLLDSGTSAASLQSGQAILTLLDASTNTWTYSAFITFDGATQNQVSGGRKSLSPGPLDRIRLTTLAGTDTFDAGSINILYE